MGNQSWQEVLRIGGLLIVIFQNSFWRQKPNTQIVVSGSHKISIFERLIQLVLLFFVAAYAIWSMGLSRLVGEYDLKIILQVLLIAASMIFLYYLAVILTSKENRAVLTNQTPSQRKLLYIRILINIVAITLLNYFLK